MSFVTKFATHSLKTTDNIMAMNGTAAPTATRLTANALARLMEEKPDSATFQPVLQIAGALLFCRVNESVSSHSFILSRVGSFLFPFRERCGPFAVLASESFDDARDHRKRRRRRRWSRRRHHCVVSLSLSTLSFSLARASRGGI